MFARVGELFRANGVRVLAAAAAGVCCLAVVAAAQAANVTAGILKVRLGGDQVETRIVIDMNRSATGKIASDGAQDRRLVLNLNGASVEGPLQGAGLGLVKNWVVDQ